MKDLFLKIWKDPVWSKVISVAILGLVTLIYTVGVQFYNDVSFSAAWNIVINTEIKLWYAITAIACFCFLTYFISRPKRIKISPKLLLKREELRKINSGVDAKLNLRTKWSVYFFENGTPYVNDFQIYCTNHPFPLKFINNKCPANDCKNFDLDLDTIAAKNHVQSMIEYKWDEINRK